MKYRIRQYKTYVLDYYIEAENEIKAIVGHMKEKSVPDLDSLSFIEEPTDIGMGRDNLTEGIEPTDEEESLIFDSDDDFLPGIHFVEAVQE